MRLAIVCRTVSALAMIVCIANVATAQPYDLSWHAAKGGGTASMTGGPFTIVGGTAGQPDASQTMSGGPYAMVGGFWAMPADAAAPADTDLSITIDDTADPIAAGQPIVYLLTAMNHGPAEASSVIVVTTLPAESIFEGVSGTDWACHHSGGVVTCTRLTLPAGAPSTISIVATAPAAAGTLAANATIAASSPDQNAVNNADVETTAVNTTSGTPPTILITGPTADPTFVASAPLLMLSGIAADTDGIAAVTWSNHRGGSGTAAGTNAWSAMNVVLFPGANVLTVTATDTDGATATDVLVLTLNARTYYLSEGATSGFFDMDLIIANPNAATAAISLTFLLSDGSTITETETLLPTSRRTIRVDDLAPLQQAVGFSTIVTSTNGLPLIVERTMRWDASGYGAHAEKAIDQPALRWYFAEGSQGFFSTYLLLANLHASTNKAVVEYQREHEPPILRTYSVPSTSRLTIDLGMDDELVHRSFGMSVTFEQPGVAERAMYFGTSPFWTGGHESAGVIEPSSSWFLAEGATGPYFQTFILLANPSAQPADVTMTYLPNDGVPVTTHKTVGAHRRLTIDIETEDESLANVGVATRIESTVPIVAERAQYWPFDPGSWFEAHGSPGVTQAATRWGLADGRTGGPENYQTYILLANSGASAADVTLTFLGEDGAAVTHAVRVAPTSRFTLDVGEAVPDLPWDRFSVIVTSTLPITVERAMYSNANGITWAAGTSATATRLP